MKFSRIDSNENDLNTAPKRGIKTRSSSKSDPNNNNITTSNCTAISRKMDIQTKLEVSNRKLRDYSLPDFCTSKLVKQEITNTSQNSILVKIKSEAKVVTFSDNNSIKSITPRRLTRTGNSIVPELALATKRELFGRQTRSMAKKVKIEVENLDNGKVDLKVVEHRTNETEKEPKPDTTNDSTTDHVIEEKDKATTTLLNSSNSSSLGPEATSLPDHDALLNEGNQNQPTTEQESKTQKSKLIKKELSEQDQKWQQLLKTLPIEYRTEMDLIDLTDEPDTDMSLLDITTLNSKKSKLANIVEALEEIEDNFNLQKKVNNFKATEQVAIDRNNDCNVNEHEHDEANEKINVNEKDSGIDQTGTDENSDQRKLAIANTNLAIKLEEEKILKIKQEILEFDRKIDQVKIMKLKEKYKVKGPLPRLTVENVENGENAKNEFLTVNTTNYDGSDASKNRDESKNLDFPDVESISHDSWRLQSALDFFETSLDISDQSSPNDNIEDTLSQKNILIFNEESPQSPQKSSVTSCSELSFDPKTPEHSVDGLSETDILLACLKREELLEVDKKIEKTANSRKIIEPKIKIIKRERERENAYKPSKPLERNPCKTRSASLISLKNSAKSVNEKLTKAFNKSLTNLKTASAFNLNEPKMYECSSLNLANNNNVQTISKYNDLHSSSTSLHLKDEKLQTKSQKSNSKLPKEEIFENKPTTTTFNNFGNPQKALPKLQFNTLQIKNLTLKLKNEHLLSVEKTTVNQLLKTRLYEINTKNSRHDEIKNYNENLKILKDQELEIYVHLDKIEKKKVDIQEKRLSKFMLLTGNIERIEKSKKEIENSIERIKYYEGELSRINKSLDEIK